MPTSSLTLRRAETWLEATQAGYTMAQIARLSGVSRQYVRRLVAKARAEMELTAETTPGTATDGSPSSPTPDIPRLELVASSNPTICSHAARSCTGSVIYCLGCDAISTDGGRAWHLPESPETPRISVLAPDHHGRRVRKQRIEPRPYQAPPEPSGATSYRPGGLKGGKA